MAPFYLTCCLYGNEALELQRTKNEKTGLRKIWI